jgi:hypothetical protein
MANQTGSITVQRDQKNVIDVDLYTRYEITGTNVRGSVYIHKTADASFSTSATVTLTKV